MKIEINGFSIEVTTDDQNLSIKISDANGKELSSNTYSQKSTIEEPKQAPLPSAEETASTETASTEVEEGLIPTFEQFKKSLKK